MQILPSAWRAVVVSMLLCVICGCGRNTANSTSVEEPERDARITKSAGDPSLKQKAETQSKETVQAAAPRLGPGSQSESLVQAIEKRAENADSASAVSVAAPQAVATQTTTPQSSAASSMPPDEQLSTARLGFLGTGKPTSAELIRSEASELVKDVVLQFPQSNDALEVKARMHLLLGESNAAKASWEQALKRDPYYSFAIYGLGNIALLQKNYEEAVKLLQEALPAFPDYAKAHHDLSDAYVKSGEVEKAIAVLKAYSETHADSAETYVLLGHAYMANQEFEPAKEAFEKTLQLQPDVPRAQEGLGRALIRLGERERARLLLAQQRESRANESTNRSQEQVLADELVEYCVKYMDVAKVYMGGGAGAKAQQVLERAVVLDPKNTQVWSALLGLYQRGGDIDKAVSMAAKMCQENEDSASAFYTCGLIQAKAGLRNSALESLNKVITLAPESYTGYEALARMLIQSKSEFPKALQLAEKTVSIRGSASDHELLAQAYAVNGQMDKAHEELSRAIELDPQNAVYAQAMKQLEQFRAGQK